MAKDTAHGTQQSERAHRLTRAKWPRMPSAQHNNPSGHTGEQEPSGQGHPNAQHNTPSGHTGEGEPSNQGSSAHNTTHQAGTAVHRSQVANDTAHTAHLAGTQVTRSRVTRDTAHTTQQTERAHR